MDLVSLEEMVELVKSLNVDLGYREIFYLYYLTDKENDQVRLGEVMRVIYSTVFN